MCLRESGIHESYTACFVSDPLFIYSAVEQNLQVYVQNPSERLKYFRCAVLFL